MEEGKADMVQSSLEPRMAKLKADLLAWCKDIGHIADFLRGLDVVDGYVAMPLDVFYIADNTVFGSQGADVGRLASTLWK